MTVANQIGLGVTLALALYLIGNVLLWAFNKTAPKPDITFLGPQYYDLHIYGVVHDDATPETPHSHGCHTTQGDTDGSQ